MKSISAILLLALAAPCWGQTSADIIKSDLIKAPDHADPGGYFTVRTPPGLAYKIEPEPVEFLRTVEEGTGVRVLFVLYAKAPGYTITIDHAVIHPTEEETKAAPWDDRVKFAEWLAKHSTDEIYRDSHFVKVGKDPGPDPDPDPEPDPDVKPPIPEPGFRVLMIFDDRQDPPLSAVQQAVISGVETDAYLNEVCIDEADGQSGWRAYDKDADLSNELPLWREAHKRRPANFKTPWAIISNGRTGYEGPLPATPSAFIELCRKYELK